MAVTEASVPAVPVVLIVDSEESRREELTSKLEHAGYGVIACSSSAQALASYGDAVAVVVTQMEIGDEDGAVLTRQLKDRAGEHVLLPVVILGGGDRVRAFEAGCDEYLDGEISFFEVDARIRMLLSHRWHYMALAEANRRLREVQEKKKDLAALVVHDLRNPLSVLQGNIDLLYEELAADTRVAGILADSQEVARKALTMVAGILDVEELEEGLLAAYPHPVIVGDFLERISKHHRVPIEVRNLRLEFDVAPELEAEFDVELVGRVVENLLDNSVRYAPSGGVISLSAAMEADDLVLRVGNDGPPVPPEDQARIFERFFRIEARRAGAKANRGLGLYFCYLVAEVHGGSITVESLPKLPACFALRLPQPQAHPESA